MSRGLTMQIGHVELLLPLHESDIYMFIRIMIIIIIICRHVLEILLTVVGLLITVVIKKLLPHD